MRTLHWLRRWFVFQSINSMIIWLFIPIIILFLLINSLISTYISERQIKENAYVNISDTLAQTQIFLDSSLGNIFAKLYSLENNRITLSIISKFGRAPDIQSELSDRVTMNEIVDNIYSSEYSIIDSIFIYFNNGKFVLNKGTSYTDYDYFNFHEWRELYNDNKMDYYWLNIHSNIISNMNKKNELFSVFKLIGNSNTKANGIILFNLHKKFFADIIANPKISQRGYMLLISNDNVFSSKGVDPKYQTDSKVIEYLRNEDRVSGQISFKKTDGVQMDVVYRKLKTNNWKVAAIFPRDDIINNVKSIKYYTFLLLGCLILIAVVSSNILARIITDPITKLKNKVKYVELGDLNVKFNIRGSQEIILLSRTISDLVTKIKNLLEQVRKEQENKRKAEIAILQAQIKPHFLYNTLESIRQLSDMEENKLASAMIVSLANYYRISLSRGEEMVNILEEVENVKNYLFILQLRYNDKFDFEIEVEHNILPYFIPKLSLQPLVENAIYHGIKQKKGKGKIIIDGKLIGENIQLTISDNGIGMTPEELLKLQQRLVSKNADIHAFGTINVHERIKAYFGIEYGLQFESLHGNGMVVKIIIPQQKHNGEEDENAENINR